MGEPRPMYASPGCLPHLLPPESYWCPEHFAQERAQVLDSAWHLVGTTSELAVPGDFLTLSLMGVEIQVRNFDGELRALSNVCAHRHCLISDQRRGRSATMKCQYHGWEYGPSGRTRSIPKPENFVPFPHGKPCLPGYRLETIGNLVFANLDPAAPSLESHLGSLAAFCASRFGPDWEVSSQWDWEYSANWKIPVENSLEAYHVPCVHPHSFKEDPGEERSSHLIEKGHTAFETQMPFAHTPGDVAFQRAETWMQRLLGGVVTERYAQHHVFPNLLFSFTDTMSFCQCVIPTGPTTCRAKIVQCGSVPRAVPRPYRWVARVWNRLKGLSVKQILREDKTLFHSIQRGMEASQQKGMLGRCEERIHAFQLSMTEALKPPN